MCTLNNQSDVFLGDSPEEHSYNAQKTNSEEVLLPSKDIAIMRKVRCR